MPSFPTPFGGVAALYPVVVAKRYPVAILQFTDGTEQRYPQSAPVHRLTLRLEQITGAEKDEILDFFKDSKGSFSSWDLTLGSTTYNYMRFAGDDLPRVENEDQTWSMTVEIEQGRKS